MADNIEHVISYWVIFQKFHRPRSALSRWSRIGRRICLFAAYTGGLADRFDIRRLIQIGMLLFMGVSVGWGMMFCDRLDQQWKAMVLLVIHGLAGVIWMPAAQVLIHRIVGVRAVAERGATERDRALSGVSGGSGGRRRIAAACLDPIYGIFHQCADLCSAVRVADQERPMARGRAGCGRGRRESADIPGYMVDHEGGAREIRCCCR